MKVKISHVQAVNEIQELDLSLETPRGKEYVIGRSPDADFILDDPDISRFHCKFYYKSGNYYFCDLSSRNGSIVNNKIIPQNQPHLLSDGDIVRIGDYVLVMEDTVSMNQPEQTVVRIINPALFTKNPSTKNIESDKPVFMINQNVVNIPEADLNIPIAQEAQTTDEVEVITSEDTGYVEFLSAGELTTPQSDLVVQQPNENEVVQTPVSESISESISESNSESNSIATPDIPVAPAGNYPGFATPEYTIVQSRNIVNKEPNLIDETFGDVSDNLLDDELLDATHVQERNVGEIINQSEELSSSTTQENESELIDAEELSSSTTQKSEPELIDANDLEIPTLSQNSSTGIGESQNQEAEKSVIDNAATIETNGNSPIDELIDELEEDIKSSSEIAGLEDISVSNVFSTTEDEEVAPVEETQPEEILETTSESQIPTVVTEKYTVLIAHDSKQLELVNFVKKHQELLSGCLTMTWDSVSKSLEEQTGINVSEAIPAATSGGYQRIVSLINSDDILAVIFFRDLLQPQPGQANEETFLRLCNINQVLLATNLPTAEAVVYYMHHGL